jgi:hypothetical protein
MIANVLAEKAKLEARLEDLAKELAAVKTARDTAEQRAGASSGLSVQLSDAWVRLREVQEELDAAKRDKVHCYRSGVVMLHPRIDLCRFTVKGGRGGIGAQGSCQSPF